MMLSLTQRMNSVPNSKRNKSQHFAAAGGWGRPLRGRPCAQALAKPTNEKCMNTEKLLKTLLVSNIVTAVIALSSAYFAYQSMESADWAYSEASSASSYASDAADAASYIKRWGVDCN